MVLVLAITLFACESNYQNVKKMGLSDGAPLPKVKTSILNTQTQGNW